MSNVDINVQELSKRTGIKAPVIYKIVSGETPNPGICSISPLAKFFGVSINQLIGEEPLLLNKQIDPAPVGRYLVPLINWNEIVNWEDNHHLKKRNKTVSIDFNSGTKTFALLIETDEFFPTFPEDTILIVDPEIQPSHKSYAIVCTNKGSANLRQVFFDNDKIYLKPITDQIPASLLNKDEYLYGMVLEAKIKFNKKIIKKE